MTTDHRQSIPSNPTVAADRSVWPAVAFAISVVVYLFVFYRVNHLHGIPLGLLLLPDVLVNSWVGFDWSRFGIADHLPVIAMAGAIFAVAFATGHVILRAIGAWRFLDRLEVTVFGIAVGLNVWSLFVLAVGLAGGLKQRWIFWAAGLAISCLAAVRFFSHRGQELSDATTLDNGSDELSSTVTRTSTIQRSFFWGCIPFAIMLILGGTLPPTHFDVREYHLQVPKEWFQEGRVSFLPHNVYGNMPLGAEMHALLGMAIWPGADAWWWGALVGKTVISSISIVTALGIYAAGRRFFTPTAGAVAAFMYLSTPWTSFVSMNGLIDGVSALYNLTAVAALGLYFRHSRRMEEEQGDNKRYQALSLAGLAGFLAGAGVACKYPALLFLVAPLFVLLACWSWPRTDWRAAVVFTVAVFAGCGLWLAKNWALADNPTYPLLSNWLDGKSWTEEQNARWERAHGPPHGGGREAYAPSEVWNSFKLVLVASDYLSPALIPLAFAGLLAARFRRSLALLAGLILWTLAVWWVMTHRVDRFLMPLLPLVALFCGVGATWKVTGAWWYVSVTLVTWSGIASFTTNSTSLVNDYRYLVSLKELRTDLPHPADPEMTRTHPAHRYLNEHVQPGYKALLVGEAQVFDLEVPILYNTCFDDCNFEALMRDRSREERLQAFKQHRISHVFFYWRELDRYRSPGNYGYSEYVTRELVRNELAGTQRLLRRVPLDVPQDNSELYEVDGWQDW